MKRVTKCGWRHAPEARGGFWGFRRKITELKFRHQTRRSTFASSPKQVNLRPMGAARDENWTSVASFSWHRSWTNTHITFEIKYLIFTWVLQFLIKLTYPASGGLKYADWIGWRWVSDGEDLVLLLWGVWSISSLSLLPGPLTRNGLTYYSHIYGSNTLV